MMKLAKYTFGMGDRFGKQGEAQLAAIMGGRKLGIDVAATWNKSHREHTIIGTEPQSLREEADAAVAALNYEGDYYIDADHIKLETVDAFIPGSNFFTLDVADFVGESAPAADIDAFVAKMQPYFKELAIEGLAEPLHPTEASAREAASQFLKAVQEAGKIYRHIAANKEEGTYAIEVSADETDKPQSPEELLFVLAMIAQNDIPAQTIAPKFTGRFNKGVDYVGDLVAFEKEFDEDLSVIKFAIAEFGLPETLKLSVHSGSDKFSIYPIINKLIKKHDAGLHVKTAGTTWLEEVIGLAEAGGDGLALAKEIYQGAFEKAEELCAPYATVINIDHAQLPDPSIVNAWNSDQFVNALRHCPDHPEYNNSLRQLIHVGFKVAAKMGPRYLDALETFKVVVNRNVTENILDRHIKPILG